MKKVIAQEKVAAQEPRPALQMLTPGQLKTVAGGARAKAKRRPLDRNNPAFNVPADD